MAMIHSLLQTRTAACILASLIVLAGAQLVLKEILEGGTFGPTPGELIWPPIPLWLALDLASIAFAVVAAARSRPKAAVLYAASLAPAAAGTSVAWLTMSSYIRAV